MVPSISRSDPRARCTSNPALPKSSMRARKRVTAARIRLHDRLHFRRTFWTYEVKESANRLLSNTASETTWNAFVNLSDSQFRLAGYKATQERLRALSSSQAFSAADREAVALRWPSSADMDVLVNRSLKAALLASLPTRLQGINRDDQMHLINVGYVITDATLLGEFGTRAYSNSIIASPKTQHIPGFLQNLLSAKFRLPFPARHCLANAQGQISRANRRDARKGIVS